MIDMDSKVGDGTKDRPRRVCPKTGRLLNNSNHWRWLIAGAGLMSLVWFLARVIPKPSRAAYPCQRLAAPAASGFVIWLLGLMASSVALRKARESLRRVRVRRACMCLGVAAAAAAVAIMSWPEITARAYAPEPHGPIGQAKGVFPGRVVWVHAPDATDWAGYSSTAHWWEPTRTDLAVVEEMFSQAVRSVAGASNDAEAWDAIFKYFNETRGRGKRGYQAGEKIMVKINLTACNARGEQVDPVTYEKKESVMNSIDNSPQMLLAMLRHLVYTVGVSARDITVGDPTGMFPNFMYNMLHNEFPEVHCLDNLGGANRTRAEFSTARFGWSTAAANGKLQDYLPVSYANADYMVNFAILKGHSAGITVCAKNHYGSLLRCPDGYLRDAGNKNYYDMHSSLPGSGASGTGKYRALVDLMGHPNLGGKTLIYLVDGLFGGYYWDSHPYKWKMTPFGNGVTGDWPSSLFASLDPVAIDSVAHDFLLQEWPGVVGGGSGAPDSLQGGAEDYLHEASMADNPPSGAFYDPDKDGIRMASLGVHEHWNNPVDKQYSRNLGLNDGIELVALRVSRNPQLAIRKSGEHAVVSWRNSLAGYRLESASIIAPSASWTAVSDPPIVFQGLNIVSNRFLEGGQFYRLTK